MEEVLHKVTKLDEFLMHKMRTTEKRFDKHFIPIKRKKELCVTQHGMAALAPRLLDV